MRHNWAGSCVMKLSNVSLHDERVDLNDMIYHPLSIKILLMHCVLGCRCDDLYCEKRFHFRGLHEICEPTRMQMLVGTFGSCVVYCRYGHEIRPSRREVTIQYRGKPACRSIMSTRRPAFRGPLGVKVCVFCLPRVRSTCTNAAAKYT